MGNRYGGSRQEKSTPVDTLRTARFRSILISVVAVFGAIAGSTLSGSGRPPNPSSSINGTTQKVQLEDLSDLSQLRKVFETDRGKLRIVALLSPT
jgi:hypothetical protein